MLLMQVKKIDVGRSEKIFNDFKPAEIMLKS